ncbi:hypothetical protein ACFQYP_20500 [Nonomuraea antimicrobica]
MKLSSVRITERVVCASGSSPGWMTSTLSTCQSDHADATLGDTARARQRTSQPSVSFPAGTASAARAPASTPATFPAQICPLPCPSGAPGSCSISNSAVSASPRGSVTFAASVGVSTRVTVRSSIFLDGVTSRSFTAGAESGRSTTSCCQPDQGEASSLRWERTRQRTVQPSVSRPVGTTAVTRVPAVPSTEVVQICPLPWPSGAEGSCSISNSARRSPPGP